MATPKLALIPTGYKAGKLYSVLPESGVGDFTVVRATEATRVNEEGLIETMGANVPRLDYSGGGCPVLLTEPQRTNLITYSEDFSDASWTNVEDAIITNNSTISPTGELNATLFAAGNSSNFHRIAYFLTITNSISYTHSIFVKKQNFNYFTLRFNLGSGGYNNVCFDLSNGTLVYNGLNCTPNIESYDNDWFKLSISFISIGTSGAVYYYITENPVTTSSISAYVGNDLDGLYIFGAQLEQSSYPTSYIKTEGSAVTRNSDQVFGSGDAATFNDSEGVLMAEISALANDLTNRYILLGTTSNNVYIRYQSSSNSLRCNVTVNGSSQFIAIVTLDDETINSKISVKYKENDFNLYVNGFKLETDLSGSTFTDGTLTELAFDNGNSNQFPFYGKTSQIQYFNTALTDSELETLTSWTSFIEMAQAQNYNII